MSFLSTLVLASHSHRVSRFLFFLLVSMFTKSGCYTSLKQTVNHQTERPVLVEYIDCCYALASYCFLHWRSHPNWEWIRVRINDPSKFRVKRGAKLLINELPEVVKGGPRTLRQRVEDTPECIRSTVTVMGYVRSVLQPQY